MSLEISVSSLRSSHGLPSTAAFLGPLPPLQRTPVPLGEGPPTTPFCKVPPSKCREQMHFLGEQ